MIKRLRHKLLHKILTVILIAAAPWLSGEGQTNGPVLEFGEPVYDFGEHDNASDVEHSFAFRNTGSAPLQITHVRSGCGCTKAELSTNLVAPGASATLATRVCIKGLHGPKRTSIYVHSNDPAKPVYQLLVTGKAVSDIEIEPRIVAMNWHAGDNPPSARIAVFNKSNTPLHITNALISASMFSASVATNEDGRSYSVSVGLKTNQAAELCQTTLALFTDHPRYPRLEIPVSASLEPEIAALPSQIFFNPGSEQQTRYIVLRSPREKEFKVTALESSTPTIPVSLQSVKPTWIRFRVGPLVPNASCSNAVITIRTDLAGAAVITIPVKLMPSQP